MIRKRQPGMAREPQAETAFLRKGFDRQAKLEAAIWKNLKELGYDR